MSEGHLASGEVGPPALAGALPTGQPLPVDSQRAGQDPSSSYAAASSQDGEDNAGRKRSSRIGKMETKKKEDDERRAREELEAQRKAEEKRIARLKRKQERAQAGLGDEHRCELFSQAKTF